MKELKALDMLRALRKMTIKKANQVALYEAIEELEALQEPKTCEGCIMQNSFYLGGCATHAPCVRKATDRYNPKYNQ